MQIEEVNIRVKKVIAEVLEMNENEISDDANFITDLGASSLQSIRLIVTEDWKLPLTIPAPNAISGITTRQLFSGNLSILAVGV